ncbi:MULTISPECIES: ribosomal-processing cysteine protease Prp [Paenibacillus]|uniref:Ribosomal processing cysteine protease Prp n=1 Tax=Paenibacillus chondroitinus TaxID=59842 RepID=A0ABU6DD62_9BACL|nr:MULTISPECIES: ribosomal-processing cysteine protease Prp [Paenibacillus]MCY9659006.1 ribosomal-processing cysteine protease Prp [Paenibacillus anseongense]MEB4794826.1 ribosomal-processing cysteine protease Prp [Paenibacillus chondroitinus]
MIYVTIKRLVPDSPQIVSFVVEGHAEFDVPGKDLVCAAVSAVTFGTYNSIESLTGVIPIHEMERGFMDITIPDSARTVPEKWSQIQVILESMVVMLETIADNYGDYITIKTIYNKGG